MTKQGVGILYITGSVVVEVLFFRQKNLLYLLFYNYLISLFQNKFMGLQEGGIVFYTFFFHKTVY